MTADMLFGKAPANRTAAWHPSPDFRGSFEILSSCLITLSLCVWTAVHLNIPKHDPRPKRSPWDPRSWPTPQRLRKIGWLILGVLAPEMVAFTAWVQRRAAHQLTKSVTCHWNYVPPLEKKEALRDKIPGTDEDVEVGPGAPTEKSNELKPEENAERPYAWTHAHSYLVEMGGFAVDTSRLPVKDKYLHNGRERVVLSPSTIVAIARHDPSLIPNISQADIEDKSKAGAITKTLVCIQAIWFCAQCIYRLAQGLSISLLELNTFGHCLCALLIYFLWWDKPFDIEEPILITKQRIHGLTALLCTTSRIDGVTDYHLVKFPDSLADLCVELGLEVNQDSEDAMRDALRTVLQAELDQKADAHLEAQPVRRVRGTAVTLREKTEGYTDEDKNRWNMAFWEMMSKGQKYGRHYSMRICDRRRNTPCDFDWEDITNLELSYKYGRDGIIWLLAFTLSGLVYGGLHLLAWNAPFTSLAQQMLWRISATTIVASGPILTLTVYGVSAVKRLRYTRPRLFSLVGLIWLAFVVMRWLGLLFGLAGCLLYAFARTYVVVECFISFAYLPDAVFKQPQWVGNFPHIQ